MDDSPAGGGKMGRFTATQRLLAEGRVPDVKKYGRSWMIPPDVQKPSRPQEEWSIKKPEILSRFSFMWDSLLQGQDIDAVVQTAETDALRAQYLGEIAYLRGDFGQARHFVAEALDDEAMCICASLFSMLVAISTNDFELYSRIEAALKRRIETADEPRVAVLVEIVLATGAVGMFAPQMVPGWLREGDFARLPADAVPFALYLRVKYLQNLAEYPQMFAVAQAIHTLCRGKGTVMEIYLLLMCAAASVGLGKKRPGPRISAGSVGARNAARLHHPIRGKCRPPWRTCGRMRQTAISLCIRRFTRSMAGDLEELGSVPQSLCPE